ncbi:peptidase U32 family protein [Salidesulfovibrio onnuriiensis]|uniref:peptidase U32 family protein n=1 Tax=Salidesulfovibrio onnuriiensis TaxID=2583823 RepID=UPI0011C88226|nr:peptidase U32 family protein [Salidesulfovibrio onnuriiensis]
MKRGNRNIPELLAPAGNMEKLETAILYGADAVYLGGGALNLRAGAAGFTEAELPEAIKKAHDAGVKVYFAMNVYPREDMLPQVEKYLGLLGEALPDAIIASDPGVIAKIRKLLPDMPVHVSTQANTCNSWSVEFWRDLGARRVNVAREVRSAELMQMLAICRKQIRDMELEVFVHGAQCMAISGRCYMSAYLNDRPGNLGQCSHPCRYEYRPTSVAVEEKTRPGEDLWVVQDYCAGEPDRLPPPDFCGEEGSRDDDEFIFEPAEGPEAEVSAEPALHLAAETGAFSKFFAAEDLCLIHYLDWFSRIGVASIKLEGRTKSSAYLAQVVDAYRTALDDLGSGDFKAERYLAELVNAASRPLTTGFFDISRRAPLALPPDEEERRPVLARINEDLGDGRWRIEVKSRWDTGGDVEVLVPGLDRPRLSPEDYGLENDLGQGLDMAHPGMKCTLYCAFPALKAGMFLRKPWSFDALD